MYVFCLLQCLVFDKNKFFFFFLMLGRETSLKSDVIYHGINLLKFCIFFLPSRSRNTLKFMDLEDLQIA